MHTPESDGTAQPVQSQGGPADPAATILGKTMVSIVLYVNLNYLTWCLLSL